MTRTEKTLYALLFLGLTVAVNVYISQHLVRQGLENFRLPPIPKIVAVDLDKIVQDKLNSGMTVVEVVTFTDTLTTVLLDDGYIILDKKTILNAPSKHIIKDVSATQLDEMVKERGIKVRDNKSIEEAIKTSKAQLDDLLKTE